MTLTKTRQLETPDTPAQVTEMNPFKIMAHEIRSDKVALVSLLVMGILVLTVYLWSAFIDPSQVMFVDLRNMNRAPSADHWLGTDLGGRDMLEMTILSARTSFNIAFVITFFGMLIGVPLGLASGFYGGKVDNAIMRVLDFYAMIPAIMLIIVLIGAIGEYTVVTFTLILVILWSWQGTTRLVRIKALQQSNLEYIHASKTLGTPNVVILFREMLPNLVSIVTSNLVLNLAANMGIETGLTFLGFGLPFPTPSLGRILANAQNPEIMVHRPWQWVPAAVLILTMMLCINFVGQAINRSTDAKKRAK